MYEIQEAYSSGILETKKHFCDIKEHLFVLYMPIDFLSYLS